MDKLTFNVSLANADIIMNALGRLPYEVVADLITDLRVQAIPQIQSPTQEPQNANSTKETEFHSESNQETGSITQTNESA
jgi:hypothetical protein